MKVVITCPSLDKIAGIENYVLKLIRILLKFYNTEIFIYPVFEYDNSKINSFFLNKNIKILKNEYPILYKSKNHVKSAKKFELYCSFYNFDLIIDNTGILPISKKILIQKNYYLIQHFDVKHFLYKFNSLSGFFKRLWWFFLRYPLKFKYASNIVVFTKFDETLIKKYSLNRTQNFFQIPLCSFDRETIIKHKNNLIFELENKLFDLIYIGRLVKKYKRLYWMKSFYKIIKKNNWNIKVYGFGDYKEKLEKIIGTKIFPIGLKNELEKIEEYTKSRFSFLLSPYEGFPYAVVESLSLGVPVILSNSFITSNYFKPALKIKNNRKSIFLKNIEKLVDFYKKNNEEYYKLCISSIDFALNKLTQEIFEENWKFIFKKHKFDTFRNT